METKTKQRWVGFLILLGTLMIFLPLVFHNTHPAVAVQSRLKIPPTPKIEIVKNTPQQEQIALKVKSTIPLTPSSSSSALTAIPEAWTIQLGSFSNHDHANALITQLRQAGFDAYTRLILGEKGQRLWRVYVGPEIQKKRAIQLRDKLKATVHLKGIVLKYVPNNDMKYST